MSSSDVQAALDTGASLNATLSRLGLTTEPAGHYQKHIFRGSGLGRRQYLYTGFASDVWGWLRAIAEGRIEVPA